ncbi:PASTA domain-containing protein [Georgenia subflava]|uniref:PASTA domain-containing protein n=2 Tax=Georgenia subflava TaxID=1622177 RepID=A0A6N7EKQ1_9MICO|nr:PASTA domain-containing protein [Georgenia subflava]
MLLAFLLVAGLGGVLTAGLVMPAVGAAGTVSQATTDLFEDLPSELAIAEPSQGSVILAADGSELATIYADNRINVSLDEVSPHMRNAVVAIEDRRFYDHNGIDPEGIMRALVNNLAGGQTEGGSTLTQQYVKNVLIEAGRVSGDEEAIREATAPTIGRKLEEARLSIGLEQQVGKEKILEGYLNIAQFGPSQYGVETAAQYYFSKPAADLTIAESAMLAGITQSPARHDPVRNPENAKKRRDTVLRTMRAQGFITEAEYDEAVALPIEDMLNVTPSSSTCAAAGISAYFCEYVVDELIQSDAWGEDADDRRQALYRGGLVIKTTLDPAKQQAAYDAVVANVPVNDPSDVNMALSSVEPGTGKIQAMVQNTNYGNATEEDPGALKLNLNVGQSHGGGTGYQSGSSFKVFTLIEWLETGHSLMDRVDSSNQTYPRESWTISCDPTRRDDWSPKNLEGIGGGRMTVLESTRRSVNVSFAEMANQMDMCAIIDNAESMGLKTGTGEPLIPNPSAVLGTNNVTPLSQATAFATLAAGGVTCEPMAITEITDRSGNVVATPESTCSQVLEPAIVNGVNHALQEVVSPRPSSTGFRAVVPGRPAAGKTGTANDDSAAWFAGYTPQLATAIWMGHVESNRSMFNSTINGQFHREVFGGLYPAQVFSQYTARALEGQPVEQFPQVSPRQLFGERVRVPNVVGRSVSDAQSILAGAGFQVQIGSPVESSWQAGGVAATQPASGAQVSPGTRITIIPSSGPPEPPPPPPDEEDDGGDGGGDDGGDDGGDGNNGGGNGNGNGNGGGNNGRGNGNDGGGDD